MVMLFDQCNILKIFNILQWFHVCSRTIPILHVIIILVIVFAKCAYTFSLLYCLISALSQLLFIYATQIACQDIFLLIDYLRWFLNFYFLFFTFQKMVRFSLIHPLSSVYHYFLPIASAFGCLSGPLWLWHASYQGRACDGRTEEETHSDKVCKSSLFLWIVTVRQKLNFSFVLLWFTCRQMAG